MNSKFLNRLEEMRQRQRELDSHILNGRPYDHVIGEQNKIALFVELGEVMNEVPTKFKHWKKSAVDNRAKALEEYVDALHFMLSLSNYHGLKYCNGVDYDSIIPRCPNNISCHDLIGIIRWSDCPYGLELLWSLGKRLGFTFDEIYEAYMAKNEVNHTRQEEGY